jgi:molybdenum cofactor biosynthesis enzyme MoaA
MGINDIALERILKFLVEEKAMVKLIKVMENEKTSSSSSSSSEPVLSSSKKKMLMWSQTAIEHTLPWLN